MNNKKQYKNVVLKNSRGFTLIELMITVAIVGILAAVALPAYQDYVARSQVSEGLTLVSGAKPVIAEYYSNHGSYPTASDIGFNGYTGSYVGTTTIGADGAIVATFSDDAHRQLRGQTVTLTPEEVDETGNLRWSCGSSIDSKFLPTSCVNDGSNGNPTNPGNGGTDPTDPGNGGENNSNGVDWDNFQAVYYEGTYSYNNGVFLDIGRPVTEIGRDENGITFQNNGGAKYHIDNDGNLTLSFSEGNVIDSKIVFFPDDNNNTVSIQNIKLNGENGTIIEQLVIPQIIGKNGNLPPYISGEGIDLYRDYANYVNIFSTIANNGQTYSNAQKEAYDNAKNNFKNYLNNYKESGGTVDKAFDYFLNF